MGTAVVAVSFDGGPHVSAAAGGAALTFYDPSAPPAIYSAEPPYAEVHASTRIVLHGSNFAPASGGAPLLCRFGPVAAVTASFISGVAVACNSPRDATPAVVQLAFHVTEGNNWIESDATVILYDQTRPLATTSSRRPPPTPPAAPPSP